MSEEYAHIKGIYEQAMKQRSLEEQKIAKDVTGHMEENFWQYVGVRIQKLVEAVMKMRQSGKFTPKQIEEAEVRVSSTLSMIEMYTLPEVIDRLTLDLVKEKNLEKLKNE